MPKRVALWLVLAVPLVGPLAGWQGGASPPVPRPAVAKPIEALNVGLGAVPADVKRDSPRETVFGYLDACRAGRFDQAAHYLFLNNLETSDQKRVGRLLARRFKFALDQTLWVDRDAVSDDPGGQGVGDDEMPGDQDQLGTIPLGAGQQSVRVQRFQLSDGARVWVFAPNTVSAIDALYETYGIGWFGDHLPAWLFSFRVWELLLWQLLALLLFLPAAYVAGRLITPLIARGVSAGAERTRAVWDDELARILPRPLRLFLSAALFGVGSQTLHLSVPAQELVTIGVRTAMLIGLGMFGQGAVRVVARELERHLVKGVTDPLRRQGVATQVSVLQRIVGGGVVLLLVSLILSQFQVVRTVGLSLLASAGIAGIAIGFAAQRSVANLFAGIQIMLTQPIRINDVVIVEGEWGNIEEITFTHVVVKIWDLRRLVVPIAYFLEKPFQNWTRYSPDLLGTIYFYTDHSIDLDGMRKELDRILAESDLWDGKAKSILVTGIKDHVVEVRALISAADSSKQWSLRCLVREKLLQWLQAQGQALPRLRLDGPGAPAGSAAVARPPL